MADKKTVDRLYQYMGIVQTMNENYWKGSGFTHSPCPLIDVTFGSRYAKVIKRDRKWKDQDVMKEMEMDDYGTSVHSFVDLNNGDILKGSWKAPVKNGVRGNIFAEDLGADRVNEHGPAYLKGPRFCKRSGIV
ncbi:uncharacterized protein METZ01_LOCUS371945 [marine metagenome]|uniref:Uncharacterized protein n=1 Tax=marine metagenome TaxID=408172 RepID=A0A382TCI9_9ZZZZ